MQTEGISYQDRPSFEEDSPNKVGTMRLPTGEEKKVSQKCFLRAEHKIVLSIFILVVLLVFWSPAIKAVDCSVRQDHQYLLGNCVNWSM
ncbi:MAG: hypothetical protein K940chlam3_01740 [Chlamydiae bacterium]|nr:hypothetical protein [Chlamydiota bacterium]